MEINHKKWLRLLIVMQILLFLATVIVIIIERSIFSDDYVFALVQSESSGMSGSTNILVLSFIWIIIIVGIVATILAFIFLLLLRKIGLHLFFIGSLISLITYFCQEYWVFSNIFAIISSLYYLSTGFIISFVVLTPVFKAMK